MKHIGALVSLSVVAVLFAGSAAHASASNLVDGSITAEGRTCSWTNASTSANPPDTLTVDRDTVNPPGGNLSCTDGSATLNNDPTVTFDDTAGTATADALDVTVSDSGVSCRYRVTDAVVHREGTTRNYSGGPYTAHKVSGSWVCPSTADVTSASVSFH